MSNSNVKLIWATPDIEKQVAFCARVSNPENQNNLDTAPKLVRYLVKNKHWSPFEMVNICLEITTTRDIARQVLRHRSFSFQEFSQRYAVVTNSHLNSEARLQDNANRQNSLPNYSEYLEEWWKGAQLRVSKDAELIYTEALRKGIAKELARKVLPEGMTESKMYMNGTLRSWLHYIDIRCDPATQKEHREVAEKCKEIITGLCPSISEVIKSEY